MHRFVALISAGSDRTLWLDRAAKAAEHFATWTSVLDSDIAKVWLQADGAAGLGYRPLPPLGVLLGRAFPGGADGAWGAFVSIQIDAEARRVSVRRDPTGRIQCWRLDLPGAHVLFSHYEDILPLQQAPLGLNWDYLAYHLKTDWLRGSATGYAEILELLPGDEHVFAPEGATNAPWWRPQACTGRPVATESEARAALRDAAERSTRAWADQCRHILLDLSGGLDSAIVLGLLRRCAGHRQVTCVNWVTESADGDERAFARDAAEFYGVPLMEQQLTADDVSLAPQFSGRLMRPTPRSLSLGYDAHGTRISTEIGAEAFFTGTGGDHLFYDHLPGLALRDLLHHRGLTGETFGVAADLARIGRETVWSIAAAVLDHAVSRSAQHTDARANPFLTAAAVDVYDADRFTHPWALSDAWNAEPAKRRQVLNVAELQRHYYRYGRAEAAEEVHPLFSQPVFEAALSIPAYWFAAGGRQRGLARLAFEDLLPPSIRDRRTKGSNTAYWTHSLVKALPQLRPLLLDGRLAARGLLDRTRLEAGLTPLALAAGKDLMPLVNCISVELWVKQAEADQAMAADPPALV